jgi:hypothetical protein
MAYECARFRLIMIDYCTDRRKLSSAVYKMINFTAIIKYNLSGQFNRII